MNEESGAELQQKILQETARYPWKELIRQFAAGNVVVVADGLDLVEVAYWMASDNATAIAPLLASGQLAKVSDEQAQQWLKDEAELWTVVVKPWIVVQYKKVTH